MLKFPSEYENNYSRDFDFIPSEIMELYDICIVGAGASGLASAWYLSDKGLNVAIFEQGEALKIDSLVSLEEVNYRNKRT